MAIPKELKDVLVADPETLSGAVRFKGTRVPVQALLDTLFQNQTIEYFLEGFPGVTQEQADAVLKFEHDALRKLLGLELAG